MAEPGFKVVNNSQFENLQNANTLEKLHEYFRSMMYEPKTQNVIATNNTGDNIVFKVTKGNHWNEVSVEFKSGDKSEDFGIIDNHLANFYCTNDIMFN